jgi:putative sigma-54 modulation protein
MYNLKKSQEVFMPLKMEIYTKELELTDRIHEYTVKKVSRLEKYLNEIDECRVDLWHARNARNSSDRYIAQVTIRGRGFILRAEERASVIYAAIDATVDKMSRQIERFKGKHWRHRGEESSKEKETLPETELDEIPEPVIVRRKSFLLTPMDELEAMEQLQLLGHEDFFVFLNAKTNQVNVLYKRRDGSYGLIETVVG